MDVTGDLDTFLADFGVNVTGPSATTGKGILDMPDSVLGGDVQVVSTQYQLTFKTSSFPSLAPDDELTISSVTYKVREVLKISDGLFSMALLEKV